MSGYGILDYEGMNQAIYRGATSNIVVDTQKMGIGIGVDQNGPSSNLHVVGSTRLEGDINMIHTSNTSSMKVNSNVVTEFNRSKKLIRYPRVALTAASGESSGYQGYYVTESSNAANDLDRTSWKAFNMTFSTADPDDTWTNDEGTNYNGTDNTYNGNINLGTGAVNGEWIKLQLPHKIRLEYMKIWLRGDTDSTRIPEDWILYGSNDNLNWTQLLSITGQGAINENQYSVNATSVYDYFAVVVTKISGQTNYFRIVELEYFGLPEYDPDAAGMDVKVASYPNVPNADWLEVYYDAKESSSYPGTGGTVLDLSGNQINGTLNGGVGFDSEYKAFTFDEADDYITLDTGKTGNYIFSVSLWFKSSGNSIETLFHMNGDYATNNTVWIKGDATSLSIGFVNNDYSCDTGKEIADNMWHHASFVYNGNGESGRDIYLDGIHLGGSLVGSNAGDNLNLTSTSSISRIGALNHSSLGIIHEFKGSIANFRLFNRAITSDEVWQLYSYQKEYFGHGDLGMTLKAGRLGIGTSEPQAMLDVRGNIYAIGSVNPVIGMWKQTIDSTTVTTTIVANIGSCMSTKTPDGYGTATGFSGSAGIFIAPYDGIYQFQAFLIGQSGSSNCLLVFNANGPSVVNGTWGTKNVIGDYREVFDLRGTRTDAEEPFTFATLLNMSKGDYVDIQNHSTGYLGNETVNCSAYLIHRFN